MAKDSGFDRDFGYLMPFFDRIASASEGLSPESRAELARLMAGEKEKWQRIRAMLSGSAVVPTPAQRGPTPARPARGPELPPGLTVGSLRRGTD